MIAQICPQGITKGSCGCTVDTANVQTLFNNSIASLYLQWPPPDPSWAVCSQSNVSGGDATIAGSAAKAAGTITTGAAIAAGAAAGSVVPVVGTIVGAIGGLIASIFGGSHAKAVAAQNNALCTAVPAANAALQAIDQGLSTGAYSAAQASAAYAQIGSQFTAAMKAGTSYKQCDALYAYNLAMQMVLAARNAALSSGAIGTAGSASPVLLYALLAAAAALFLL